MNKTELRQTFSHFDRDHNGAIDFGEFCELLQALNADVDDESRKVGFDIIDSDHSGTIDFEEFLTWWMDQG